MAAIQGKLGVRDEVVLKKVDDKILEAIARYEQKVAEQTTQKENKFTHIPKVDEIAKYNKVLDTVHALNIKIDNIARLEPLTIKPTKIV
jgi:hypothetical protein